MKSVLKYFLMESWWWLLGREILALKYRVTLFSQWEEKKNKKIAIRPPFFNPPKTFLGNQRVHVGLNPTLQKPFDNAAGLSLTLQLNNIPGSMDTVQRRGPWTPGPCFVFTPFLLSIYMLHDFWNLTFWLGIISLNNSNFVLPQNYQRVKEGVLF